LLGNINFILVCLKLALQTVVLLPELVELSDYEKRSRDAEYKRFTEKPTLQECYQELFNPKD
jgi:hypothetical protein